MRTVPALTLLLAIAALSPAVAQSDSVTVNSMGATSGGQVLYDPGTGQERVVPPLLQPWQSEPIRLHPPRKRTARHAATPAPEAPSSYASSAPETSAPVAAPVRKKRRTATAAPAPVAPAAPQKSAPISGFSDFTDLISQQPSTPTAPPPKQVPAAPPPKKAAPARKVADVPPPPRVEKPAPVEKPVQKASIEPARPAKARASAGTPKDTITFSPNASDPSTTAVTAIRSLAGSLSSALADGNARVQLMAYAGMRGEKSSDTRRLSLKRALVIRQLLIDDGVPSERIDVFALGGADDAGPLDRVDVFVKS